MVREVFDGAASVSAIAGSGSMGAAFFLGGDNRALRRGGRCRLIGDDGELHPVERLPQLVRRLGLSRGAELARTVDAWRTEIDTVLRVQPVGTRPSKRPAGGLRSRENSGLRMRFLSIRKQRAVEHQIIGLSIRR